MTASVSVLGSAPAVQSRNASVLQLQLRHAICNGAVCSNAQGNVNKSVQDVISLIQCMTRRAVRSSRHAHCCAEGTNISRLLASTACCASYMLYWCIVCPATCYAVKVTQNMPMVRKPTAKLPLTKNIKRRGKVAHSLRMVRIYLLGTLLASTSSCMAAECECVICNVCLACDTAHIYVLIFCMICHSCSHQATRLLSVVDRMLFVIGYSMQVDKQNIHQLSLANDPPSLPFLSLSHKTTHT